MPPSFQCLLRIIEIMEANYPETMGRVLIIRAPRVFPILWTLVSTFIDERTREKFLFCDDDDFQHGLKVYIPEQHIPEFLGGKAEVRNAAGSDWWIVAIDFWIVLDSGSFVIRWFDGGFRCCMC